MATSFANVLFKNNPKKAQRQPREVLIRQKEYNHDVAVITIDFEHASQKKYAKGAPVEIVWGYLPSSIEHFFGYVHHVEETSRMMKTKTLKVFCVGTSYSLNRTRQRSYKKLYVGSIINRIAREHRLSVIADPSSRWHRHIPQLGQSDMRLMVRLAKDIGFSLTVQKTTIRFVRRIIDNKPGRQPIFRHSPATVAQRGAVYELQLKTGSAVLAERDIIQVDGMDDDGNIVSVVDTGDCCDPVKPVFTKFVAPDEPVHSIHEGRALLSGLSGTNRFYVIATADLSGDPRVRPAMTIGLQDVSADADGYWWVGSVDHIITPGAYRMKAELGRETIRETKYIPVPRSDAGKPQILDEIGVDLSTDTESGTVYDALDDCVPVENLSTDPFGESTPDVPNPLVSDARRAIRNRRPRPSRPRGCCPADQDAPVVDVPRLNGWKSFAATYRTTQ